MDIIGRMSLQAWPALLVLVTLCITALPAQRVALAKSLSHAADNGAASESPGFSVTEGRQEPFWHGSLSTKGIFLAQATAPVSAPSAPATRVTAEKLAAEREFWASVKASGDPADIRAYLEQFPGGMFEALARNWLKRLEEAAQPQAAQATAAPTVSTQEAVPAPRPSPESVEAALDLTRAQRVLVQRALASLGFDVGAADGILGARSRAGIRKWQSSRGESATGYLNAGAVATLLESGEAASPEPQRRVAREAMELLAEALTTAQSIEDERARVQALSDIAKAQASSGDTRGAAQTVSEALTSVRSIEIPRFRDRALNDIVEAQAIAGDIQGALTTAQSIEHAAIRALAFSDIAKAQASSGDTRSAAQTVSEALTAARSSKRARLRAEALSDIAKAQAIAGDTRGAAQTVSEALTSAQSVKIAIFRAWALSDIAEAQAIVGDIQGALTITQTIDDAAFRVWALSGIAKAQAIAGDTHSAAQTVSEAFATVPKIDEAHERAPALRRIAGAQAIAGDIQGALNTSRSIENAAIRALALRRIAEAQAIAGDIHSALTTARGIKKALYRAGALSDITKAQLDGADVRSEPDAGATPSASADSPIASALKPPSAATDSSGAPLYGAIAVAELPYPEAGQHYNTPSAIAYNSTSIDAAITRAQRDCDRDFARARAYDEGNECLIYRVFGTGIRSDGYYDSDGNGVADTRKTPGRCGVAMSITVYYQDGSYRPFWTSGAGDSRATAISSAMAHCRDNWGAADCDGMEVHSFACNDR